MTVPGQRVYQFWNFSRPMRWELLEQCGVPSIGRSYLLRRFGVSIDEPFRRMTLFPSEKSQFEMLSDGLADAEMIWSDAFLCVANKPPGLKVHPNDGSEDDSLLHRVTKMRYLEAQQDRMRHIHRLDEATSGLVLFASCDYAQHVLDAFMRDRMIHRTYHAWVKGTPKKVQGTIDDPIGRDRNHPTKRRVSLGGQKAVTHYRVIDQKKGCSLLELNLDTGRTHQIRVHLQHLGHPILNDSLYGNVTDPDFPMSLVAVQLSFPHPWHGQQVDVRIDPPDWFKI